MSLGRGPGENLGRFWGDDIGTANLIFDPGGGDAEAS
jgi:hypothetical protein